MATEKTSQKRYSNEYKFNMVLILVMIIITICDVCFVEWA